VALVDPGERPRLASLSARACRQEIAHDADLIYDMDAIAECGLATARDHLDRLFRTIAQDPC
jgi:hypothetical protein